MKRLAIITTHPIQYNAPLFELLSKRNKIDIKVFYTWGETVLKQKYDPGFGKVIKWDIPLLEGYEYEFLANISADKGSHHFKGIDNPDIIERINNYHPDAVLVYGWSFKSHLKVLRYYKNKIPVLFRGDSTLLDKKSWILSLKRNLFLRWVYRHIDFVLYVGKNNYDYFRKAALSKGQLIFAPHAVDNQRFECASDSCKKKATGFREKLNIAPSHLVFLFAGKLEPKKDPELLLKAFAQANLTESVHLVIVGNGELENKLKEDFGKGKNIHFLDFQNQTDMPAIYEMSDVFILPSKGPGETWGLSVNEAMANGKAVIVSDKCGCAIDLVENEMNGYIFQADNLKQLKNTLEQICASGETLVKMRMLSKDKIRMYSLNNLAGLVERIVMDISK